MLTKRIIPCLDMTKGKVIKGIQFKSFRYAGDPVELASQYDKDGADELVFLDITATLENRQILLDVVKKTAEKVSIPFCVGGGIRTVEDIRKILINGADKVSINTGGFLNPKLISEAANIFGCQCIVLSADVRKVAARKWNVYIKDGRQDTQTSIIDWAKTATKLGAGEILLTSIDRDGTKKGFDVELTRLVARAVKVPVIASGGAGKLKDFYDILTTGKADAALAASLFHFGQFTIQQVKNYLLRKKVSVRKICPVNSKDKAHA